MAQHSGSVVWFNNAKGFGFLKYQGGPDVFVHFTAIQTTGYKTLKPDHPVEFDIETGKQGLQAANVKVLVPPASAK